MRESPRLRRLRSDRRILEQLQSESSIFSFNGFGDPIETYHLRFLGRGLAKDPAQNISVRDYHEVHLHLGAAYPRLMPDLSWKTPIFHPNISAGGHVCLGGYGTHWVPGVSLDDLVCMLWDMLRYQNYDVMSPYNREAAIWARDQRTFRFPIDGRPLRDRLANSNTANNNTANGNAARKDQAQAPYANAHFTPVVHPTGAAVATSLPAGSALQPLGSTTLFPASASPTQARLASVPPSIGGIAPLPAARDQDVVFLDEIIEAEVVRPAATENDDIMFLN